MRPAAVAGLLQAEALLLPQQRAELEAGEPALLGELAPQRLLVRLAGLLPATGGHPPPAVLVAVAEEQRPTRLVDDERADALPLRQPRRAPGKVAEPAQSLGPRDRRVRGRGGREHEDPRLAERPLLHAELGPLAERAAVRLLADERDPRRSQLARDLLQARGRAREVRPAQIARPRRRAVRSVRHADPLPQQLELLRGLIEPRREPRRVQQAPEVVAGIREVRARGRRDAPRIDAAEDDSKPRRENVGDVARGARCYAASASAASRASSRCSRSLRRSSPETVVGKRGRRGSSRTTVTVGSQPR